MKTHASKFETADILRESLIEYKKKTVLSAYQSKAATNIIKCRTPALGGHIYRCKYCGEYKTSYNSCRDRNCPKCQAISKERWIAKLERSLLPVPYFHTVFTVPNGFKDLALYNKKTFYNSLFKAASETIKKFAKHELKGQTGITAVVHTWGQTLIFHPHLHCIIPGGALQRGTTWVKCKNEYLFSGKAVAKMFKAKFVDILRKEYQQDNLQIPSSLIVKNKYQFNQYIDTLYQKDWVVYMKKPFGGVQLVLKYLGRYSHRVAISNHRIKEIKNKRVVFSYKDYKDNSKIKLMVVPHFEYIKRFMNHILPPRFVKIRHYGVVSNSNKTKALAACREFLGLDIKLPDQKIDLDSILKQMGIKKDVCPKCKRKGMELFEYLPPTTGPPRRHNVA
jgi:putative transposase/transposase-like zinc-binding protein